MITLDEAKKNALSYMGEGAEISQVGEISHAWIFGFRNEKTKEPLLISPVIVDKENGNTDTFFPPDHPGALASMKIIEKLDDE